MAYPIARHVTLTAGQSTQIWVTAQAGSQLIVHNFSETDSVWVTTNHADAVERGNGNIRVRPMSAQSLKYYEVDTDVDLRVYSPSAVDFTAQAV